MTEIFQLIFQSDDIEPIKKLVEIQPSLISQKLQGITPLHLAIQLDRRKTIQYLLSRNANVFEKNHLGFHALHEATSIGCRQVMKWILEKREETRLTDISQKITNHLNKETNFYMELAWEFKSFIPFVSRLCPNDCYKVYKKGFLIRIDYSLTGMSGMQFERSNMSLIADLNPSNPFVFVVDRDRKIHQSMDPMDQMDADEIELDVNVRLNSPMTFTRLETMEVCAGQTGFFTRVDRWEKVGEFEARVYDLKKIKIVQRKRSEHLLCRRGNGDGKVDEEGGTEKNEHECQKNEHECQKNENECQKNELNDYEKYEHHINSNSKVIESIDLDSLKKFVPSLPPPTRPSIDFETFANSDKYIHLGRPLEIQQGHLSLSNGTLWMTNESPLSLQDLLPIIELIGVANYQVQKVHEFITEKMPPGFPVRVEIPFLHVVRACLQINCVRIEESDDDVFQVPCDSVLDQLDSLFSVTFQ